MIGLLKCVMFGVGALIRSVLRRSANQDDPRIERRNKRVTLCPFMEWTNPLPTIRRSIPSSGALAFAR